MLNPVVLIALASLWCYQKSQWFRTVLHANNTNLQLLSATMLLLLILSKKLKLLLNIFQITEDTLIVIRTILFLCFLCGQAIAMKICQYESIGVVLANIVQ